MVGREYYHTCSLPQMVLFLLPASWQVSGTLRLWSWLHFCAPAWFSLFCATQLLEAASVGALPSPALSSHLATGVLHVLRTMFSFSFLNFESVADIFKLAEFMQKSGELVLLWQSPRLATLSPHSSRAAVTWSRAETGLF